MADVGSMASATNSTVRRALAVLRMALLPSRFTADVAGTVARDSEIDNPSCAVRPLLRTPQFEQRHVDLVPHRRQDLSAEEFETGLLREIRESARMRAVRV